MIKRARGIQVMISAVLTALPALFNVFSLLFLTFFVYAILGMTLFGNVRYGEFYNNHANFRNFGQSMLILFRTVTGESWNYIMKDLSVEAPFCADWNGPTSNGNPADSTATEAWYYYTLTVAPYSQQKYYLMNDCGSAFLAKLYFISFYVISNYAMMNLFVAVILDNFAFAVNVDLAFIKDSTYNSQQQNSELSSMA